jgi:hypothetical protein
MTDRIIQLKFDGKTAAKTAISTEIPQDSPVSLILFLIYIRNLFVKINRRNTSIFSYMDDIAIITRSKFITVNNVILKGITEKLIQKEKNQCIEFDITKTELIHFYNQKRELPGNLTLEINNEIITIPIKKNVK